MNNTLQKLSEILLYIVFAFPFAFIVFYPVFVYVGLPYNIWVSNTVTSVGFGLIFAMIMTKENAFREC